MGEKLKLKTDELAKITEKLKNGMARHIGIMERKQSAGSSFSSVVASDSKAKTKKSLSEMLQQLKEKDPNFSFWTVTMDDLREKDQVLTRRQKITLARKAQSVRIRMFINWLISEYPACFSKERPKPLKIGIDEDIKKALPPEASKILAKRALTHYTSRKEYIRALVVFPYRYDLSGKETGEVSESEKKQAQEKIAKMSPKKRKSISIVIPPTLNDDEIDEEYDNRFNR